MISKLTFNFLFLISVITVSWAAEGPNRPQAKPVKVDSKTTAILVLDMNVSCHDPKRICSKLLPGVAKFLEKARASSVPIIYTVSSRYKGKPIGKIATPLKRRKGEPVIFPNSYDKFAGGKLKELLKPKGIKNVVLIGSSTNVAVLYTATTAGRTHRYNVIIPMDGVNARSQYEQEYTFHQFTVLRRGVNKRFKFTKLSMINFK